MRDLLELQLTRACQSLLLSGQIGFAIHLWFWSTPLKEDGQNSSEPRLDLRLMSHTVACHTIGFQVFPLVENDLHGCAAMLTKYAMAFHPRV